MNDKSNILAFFQMHKCNVIADKLRDKIQAQSDDLQGFGTNDKGKTGFNVF